MKSIERIRSISEFHKSRELESPDHPLVSVINYADVKLDAKTSSKRWVFDFYSISLKRNISGKIGYGQQKYDFDEGVLFFIAPGQAFTIEIDTDSSQEKSGWILLIHPDFLWGTQLAKTINRFEFFGYNVNEALFLSPKEENIMQNIIGNIMAECSSNIDAFSQQIIISQIETMLNYAERFYNRQFITRKKTGNKILQKFEALLDERLSKNLSENGIPPVQYFASALQISPNYLSGILKTATGLNTQQHMQNRLLLKAKEMLSTTDMSIIEISYDLGFEHPQSFSKFFKKNTNTTPMQFRKMFH